MRITLQLLLAAFFLIFLPGAGKVVVCHSHGCQKSVVVSYGSKDVSILRSILTPSSTPSSERAKIKKAIAWFERRVARKAGTQGDKAGSSLLLSGIDGQMDCVDESRNSHEYLLVMQRYRLLQHHTVEEPVVRWGLFSWTHWAAQIREKDKGRRFAVDSFFSANGKPPLILSLKSWMAQAGNTPW